MDFPLFEQLQGLSAGMPAYSDQELVKYTQQVPKENRDVMQALILHYTALYPPAPATTGSGLKTRKKQVPFQGTIFEGGVGITYALADVPEPLKRILLCYVQNVIVIDSGS